MALKRAERLCDVGQMASGVVRARPVPATPDPAAPYSALASAFSALTLAAVRSAGDRRALVMKRHDHEKRFQAYILNGRRASS